MTALPGWQIRIAGVDRSRRVMVLRTGLGVRLPRAREDGGVGVSIGLRASDNVRLVELEMVLAVSSDPSMISVSRRR